MLDLTKDKSVNLPDSIFVDGKEYKIHTDHRYGMRFIKLVEECQNGTTPSLLTAFDNFYEDFYNIPSDRQKGLNELVKFYNPVEELPNRDVIFEEPDGKAFDYVLDSSRIYAAFMQCYHIDLIDTPLHWYKFLALFHNLKDTHLNEIMGYRGYNPADKSTHEQAMKKQKDLWEIREELTAEEKATLDKFNAQFD